MTELFPHANRTGTLGPESRSESPGLSVVVPCCDAAGTLTGLLESLAAQRWDGRWEVILADNGSTDGSVDIARAFSDRLPDLRVVDASRRKGAAYARNVGAAASRAPFLAFCDADDQVGEGWISAVVAALESHSLVASSFEFERLNPVWLRRLRPDHQVSELQRLWYPPFALHAGGSGLAVRRELHERIGGFDASLTRLQDTDYCIRAQEAGAVPVLAEGAVVHVRHRGTAFGQFRQSRLWAYYNSVLYVRHGRRSGQPPGGWAEYGRECRWILSRLKRVRHREGRSLLASRLGWQIGLLQASLRYRMPPLRPPRKTGSETGRGSRYEATTESGLVAR